MDEARARTTIYFDAELHHALKLKAVDGGETVSDMVSISRTADADGRCRGPSSLQTTQSRARDGFRELRDEPRPGGCQKLAGAERYRILYTVEDDQLIVEVIRVAIDARSTAKGIVNSKGVILRYWKDDLLYVLMKSGWQLVVIGC